MDLYDPNRYAKRKFFNNLRDSIWSVFLTIVWLVLAAVALYYLLPWMKALWPAVRHGSVE